MASRCFSQQDEAVHIERWVPSTCGVCSIGCGIEIGVTGAQIVGVRGRAEHPVNQGRLGPKGLNQYYANRHPSRATQPLIRNRSGQLVPGSWDAAMELVTDRFNEALATEGPDGVAIYNSGQLLLEEYYTLGKIARAGLGIATIDANTRLCTATTASSLMESFGADGPPGAYEDFDHAECIVLVGHNAAEQSTVLWMRILAAKAGPLRPKVIVVDPRRTLTVVDGRRPSPAAQAGNERRAAERPVPPAHREWHGSIATSSRTTRSSSNNSARSSADTRPIASRRSAGFRPCSCGRLPMDRSLQDDGDNVLAGRLSEQSGDRRGLRREQHAPADGQDRPARVRADAVRRSAEFDEHA